MSAINTIRKKQERGAILHPVEREVRNDLLLHTDPFSLRIRGDLLHGLVDER